MLTSTFFCIQTVFLRDTGDTVVKWPYSKALNFLEIKEKKPLINIQF